MRTATVSIGVIDGSAFDDRNDRTKVFLLKVHHSPGEIAETLHQIAADNQVSSRLTVRLVIGRELDPALAATVRMPWCGQALAFEASVPVNTENVGSLMYFGANRPHRSETPEVRQRILAKLGEFQKSGPHVRSVNTSFRVHRLDAITLRSGDIERIAEIYRLAFSEYVVELGPDLIRAMISQNMVIVARDTAGLICGITQAEIAPVHIGGMPWHIIELSDTAVHPDFKGKGVGYLVKRLALENIRGLRERAIVYAEPRANHAAIIKLNAMLGLKHGGYLPSHCRINSRWSDTPQASQYGDLLVMHL